MPILTLVIPQLKTESMKWKLEGRAVARQCQISRSLFPVLAAPSPSGQSSSFCALLFSLPCFFFFHFFCLCFFFFSSHLFSLVCCLSSCHSCYHSSCHSSSPSYPILSFSLVSSLFSSPWFVFCSLLFAFPPSQIFLCDVRAMRNLINKAQLAVLYCLSAKPEAVSGGSCKKRQHC